MLGSDGGLQRERPADGSGHGEPAAPQSPPNHDLIPGRTVLVLQEDLLATGLQPRPGPGLTEQEQAQQTCALGVLWPGAVQRPRKMYGPRGEFIITKSRSSRCGVSE